MATHRFDRRDGNDLDVGEVGEVGSIHLATRGDDVYAMIEAWPQFVDFSVSVIDSIRDEPTATALVVDGDPERIILTLANGSAEYDLAPAADGVHRGRLRPSWTLDQELPQ